MWIDENKLTRKIMKCKLKAVRSRGWPKLIWMVGVSEAWANLELKDGGWSLGIGSHGGRSWGMLNPDDGNNGDFNINVFLKFTCLGQHLFTTLVT